MQPDTDIKTYPDAEIHIGQAIKKIMTQERISASWLATRLFCDRTNIYKIIAKRSLDSDTLFRISLILKHDLFALYSDVLKKQTSDDVQQIIRDTNL